MNHYSDHITHFQLAKMFIVVLIVFGLCWLPYHAYFFYTYYHVVTINDHNDALIPNHTCMFHQHSRRHASTQHIFLAFFWLAMANSAINPLIYFQMNAKWDFVEQTFIELASSSGFVIISRQFQPLLFDTFPASTDLPRWPLFLFLLQLLATEISSQLMVNIT